MRDDTRPPREGQDPPAIRPPLRLVHPAPPPKPKVRRRKHDTRVFTTEEQRRLSAALGVARRAYGGRKKLAEALECHVNGLFRAEYGKLLNFPAALAVRLARVAKVSLDAILRPGLRVAGTCPTCGRGPT